jgi:C_GCAxxG_C_C family probable redox protein
MDSIKFRMMELKAKGFYCSQIMMLLALENQDKTNEDLVRSMAGLAFGAGIGSQACGALTGGACILSLYAGKGTDEEEENFLLKPMLQDLGEWFLETYGGMYGGVSCDVISEDGSLRNERCGAIVAETYARTIEILIANDLDPEEGR